MEDNNSPENLETDICVAIRRAEQAIANLQAVLPQLREHAHNMRELLATAEAWSPWRPEPIGDDEDMG